MVRQVVQFRIWWWLSSLEIGVHCTVISITQDWSYEARSDRKLISTKKEHLDVLSKTGTDGLEISNKWDFEERHVQYFGARSSVFFSINFKDFLNFKFYFWQFSGVLDNMEIIYQSDFNDKVLSIYHFISNKNSRWALIL